MKAVRFAVAFIIFGLVISGVTAFPLETEIDWIAQRLASDGNLDPAAYSGVTHWILQVREGLVETNKAYPFLAYGTDWLAFAHLVIALFYIPVYKDPVRYRGNIAAGLAACVGVVFLALICGHIRGIPMGWRLIDISFGVVCIVPMYWLWRWTGRAETA